MNCQMFSWLLSSGERGGKRSSRLGVLSHGRAMQIGFRRPRDRLTRCRYPRPSWVVLRPRDGADRSFAGVEEIKHRTPSMPISCLPISAQPKRAPLPTTAAVARCWPRAPPTHSGQGYRRPSSGLPGPGGDLIEIKDKSQHAVPTFLSSCSLSKLQPWRSSSGLFFCAYRSVSSRMLWRARVARRHPLGFVDPGHACRPTTACFLRSRP